MNDEHVALAKAKLSGPPRRTDDLVYLTNAPLLVRVGGTGARPTA